MIVDASIVIAALLADGTTRRLLLHATGPLSAPAYLEAETLRKLPLLATRADLPERLLRTALTALLDRIVLVPAAAYAHHLPAAKAACRDARAAGDEDYVALAYATGDAIWSLDHDFDRIKGIRRATAPD